MASFHSHTCKARPTSSPQYTTARLSPCTSGNKSPDSGTGARRQHSDWAGGKKRGGPPRSFKPFHGSRAERHCKAWTQTWLRPAGPTPTPTRSKLKVSSRCQGQPRREGAIPTSISSSTGLLHPRRRKAAARLTSRRRYPLAVTAPSHSSLPPRPSSSSAGRPSTRSAMTLQKSPLRASPPPDGRFTQTMRCPHLPPRACPLEARARSTLLLTRYLKVVREKL